MVSSTIFLVVGMVVVVELLAVSWLDEILVVGVIVMVSIASDSIDFDVLFFSLTFTRFFLFFDGLFSSELEDDLDNLRGLILDFLFLELFLEVSNRVRFLFLKTFF